MNIVFFGTSNFSLPILEALHKQHQIVAVVTAPDGKIGRKQEFAQSPVSMLAAELGLKVLKPAVLDESFLLEMQAYKADLFVVASYGKIIPQNIINLPKHKSINVHPSLLPKYRGASPIQSALLNGEAKTGTSIIVLDEQMDHGPVVAQESLSIDAEDNFFTLSDKLSHLSAKLLAKVVQDFASDKIQSKPQDESQATFTKIVSKEDGKINWDNPAQQIYNQFRAFYIWPGIWTTWNGKIIKILDCIPAQNPSSASSPAKVLHGGVVACGENSFLQIKILQMEGKNETNISDFLNGYRDFVGSSLA